MCYSAQVHAESTKYEREIGAPLSLQQYVRLFWERRRDGTWRKIPKGIKAAFAHPRNAAEEEVAALVAEGDAELAHALQAELFKQKKRLADVERTLATKVTEKAQNEQRIARDKMQAAQRALGDLRRKEPLDPDSRIYPGKYAPVMIVQDGKRVLVPTDMGSASFPG